VWQTSSYIESESPGVHNTRIAHGPRAAHCRALPESSPYVADPEIKLK